MDFMKMFFLKIKKQWNYFLFFVFNQCKMIILICFVFCFVFCAVFIYSKKNNYVVLYKDLNYTDSKWVISKLKDMHISYKFDYSSKTILVPKNKFHELYFSLINNSFYIEKRSGFELLDQGKMGITQFHERINYHRGLENELSKTLEHIFPIQHARLHLVCKKDTDFFRDTQVPSASVVVTLFPNTQLKQEQIDAITLLISGSIPDLTPNHVVLVDQFGNILNKYDLNHVQFFNQNQYKQINILKEYYTDSINKILTPLLGLNNFFVYVTARVFSDHTAADRFTTTSTKSDPLFQKNKVLDNTVYFPGFKKSDIKNLRINILVNYKKNHLGVLVPLSQTELLNIESVIKSVIDFSKNRGDNINIINYMFFNANNSLDAIHFDFYKNFNLYYFLYSFFILSLFFLFKFLKNFEISYSHDLNDDNNKLDIQNNNLINHYKCSKQNVVRKNDSKIIKKIIRYWIRKK